MRQKDTVLNCAGKEETTFILTQVSVEAAPLLSSLHHAAFVGHEPWTQTAFEQVLTMPGVEAWLVCIKAYQIAEEEPAEALPVGFMVCRFVLDEGEILSLGVHPHWRRRGIARHLLEHLVQRAHDEGITLFLEVRRGNHKACLLYEQIGFQQVAIRLCYYDDGEDARLLRFSPNIK